jgi:hypothetical protein
MNAGGINYLDVSLSTTQPNTATNTKHSAMFNIALCYLFVQLVLQLKQFPLVYSLQVIRLLC